MSRGSGNVETLSWLKDVFMPFATGVMMVASTATATFLWNMNATIAAFTVTLDVHGKDIAQIRSDVAEVKNEVMINKLDIVRVESQCMRWASEFRSRETDK